MTKERAEPAEIEPANPRSLPIGSAPFGAGIHSGLSVLLVENGTDLDALVRVIELRVTERMVRNFYIPAGHTFSANQMPAGTFVLRVALGKDWNDTKRRFIYRQSFEETENLGLTETTNVEPTDDGTITRTSSSKMTITLHKVLNGNFKSHSISEEQFWR